MLCKDGVDAGVTVPLPDPLPDDFNPAAIIDAIELNVIPAEVFGRRGECGDELELPWGCTARRGVVQALRLHTKIASCLLGPGVFLADHFVKHDGDVKRSQVPVGELPRRVQADTVGVGWWRVEGRCLLRVGPWILYWCVQGSVYVEGMCT